MSNIVIIPYYNRPAFLAVTLAQLQTIPNYRKYTYLFSLDWGCDERGVEFIKNFNAPWKIVRRVPKREDAFDKLSYNILTAYKRALAEKPDFIFLIEDDIFVTSNFFEWHIDLYYRTKNFCSIGENLNPSSYDFVQTEYKSHGVCWYYKNLQAVLGYPLAKYFGQPQAFFRQFFPRSRYGNRYTQQEGFIKRVIESLSGLVYAPGQPNAYHLGFASQQKGVVLEGDLESQIAQVVEYKNKVIGGG